MLYIKKVSLTWMNTSLHCKHHFVLSQPWQIIDESYFVRFKIWTWYPPIFLGILPLNHKGDHFQEKPYEMYYKKSTRLIFHQRSYFLNRQFNSVLVIARKSLISRIWEEIFTNINWNLALKIIVSQKCWT